MCYRPLHIKNNSNHFSRDSHALYFSAPCGHCEECAWARQSEWFVRTYYHWLEVKRNGGDAYMYTLTYNDDNLPNYNGIKCFSRDDVEKFVKRLQEHLWRKYKVRLSFIITSEFGSLYSRPHYHAIFFVDKHLMPFLLYSCILNTWQKGFIYSGKNAGLLNSHTGILYVTKYITKDTSYQKLDAQLYASMKDDYSRFYDAYNLFSYDCPSTFDELLKDKRKWKDVPEVAKFYKEFELQYRRRSAFTAHSINFGSALASYWFETCYNQKDDTCRVPNGHEYSYAPAPRFIKRKLYYDRVPNEKDGKLTKFVLNEKGIKHYVATLDNQIENMSKRFKEILSYRLTDFQFQCLLKRTHMPFTDRKDYLFFADNLMSFDTKRLATYGLVYRNHIDNHIVSDVWTQYKDFYHHCLLHKDCKDDDSLDTYSTKSFNDLHNSLFNFKPQFQNYECIFLYLQQVANLIHEERSNALAIKRETERKVRDLQKLTKLQLKAV